MVYRQIGEVPILELSRAILANLQTWATSEMQLTGRNAAWGELDVPHAAKVVFEVVLSGIWSCVQPLDSDCNTNDGIDRSLPSSLAPCPQPARSDWNVLPCDESSGRTSLRTTPMRCR